MLNTLLTIGFINSALLDFRKCGYEIQTSLRLLGFAEVSNCHFFDFFVSLRDIVLSSPACMDLYEMLCVVYRCVFCRAAYAYSDTVAAAWLLVQLRVVVLGPVRSSVYRRDITLFLEVAIAPSMVCGLLIELSVLIITLVLFVLDPYEAWN